MAFTSRASQDTFDRGDSSTIGNGWLVANSSTAFSVASNKLHIGSTASFQTGEAIYRPYTSNPTSLVPGTNEGSINQKVRVRVNYPYSFDKGAVLLRTDSTCKTGYVFGFNYTSIYCLTVVNGAIGVSVGSSNQVLNSICDDYTWIDFIFSATSTSPTSTTLTAEAYDVWSGTTIWSASWTDTTTQLQSPALSSGATVAITGAAEYAGAPNLSIDEFEYFTDQGVAYGSPLVSGAVSAGTITANTATFTGATPTGGTSPYTYRWYRSTTAPSGGNYGKVVPGLTGASCKVSGLLTSTDYWITRETTDSSSYCPQVVYSAPVKITTSAGSANNPGNLSSLKFWLDAKELTGQTDGQPLSGQFGPFSSTRLSTGFTAPTYNANTLPNNEPALTFGGTNSLSYYPGECPDLDNAFAGSFTYTLVFNMTSANTTNLTLLNKSRISATLVGGRCLNADGYGSAHTTDIPLVPPKTTPANSEVYVLSSPVNVFQFSYDATTHQTIVALPNGRFYHYSGDPTLATMLYRVPTTLGQFVGFNDSEGLYPLVGQISQLLVHDSALTKSQMSSIQDYFRSRYSTEATDLIARVYTLGDSRTEGVDGSGYTGTFTNPVSGISFTTNSWPAQLGTALGSRYTVRNIGEARTQTPYWYTGNGRGRMDSTPNILLEDPAKPTIYAVGPIGVNDFGHDVDASSTATNYIGIVNTIEAGNNADNRYTDLCVWCTELDADLGGSQNEAAWLTFRSTMMTAVKAAIPAVDGVRAIADLTPNAFVGAPGACNNTAYFSDKLHPNGQNSSGTPGSGYGVMAALIEPEILNLTQSGDNVPATSYNVLIPNTTVGETTKAVVALTGGFTLDSDLVVTLADSNATIGGTIAITNGNTYGFTTYTPTTAGSHSVTATHTGGNSGMTNPSATTLTATAAPTYASAGNVRSGVNRGDGTLGTLAVPSAANVRSGVAVDATTGTCAVPSASNVRSTIAVDNTTGTLTLPTASQVLASVQYGVGGTGSTGNVVLPTVDHVQAGTTYGANGSALTGTYSAGSSAPTSTEVAQALWSLADGIEPGESPRQTLRVLRSVLAGKASDSGTSSAYKRKDGTTTALSLTHDEDGNRTASTVGTLTLGSDPGGSPSTDATAYATAILDLSNGIETGETPRQTLRLLRSVLAGTSDAADTTVDFRRKDGTTTALTVEHDEDGNRTASTVGTL